MSVPVPTQSENLFPFAQPFPPVAIRTRFKQVIARRDDMPRRSRRICVRVRTDPQSAQLWWLGLGVARLAGPGGTDRRTDRRTDGRTDGSRIA